MRTATRVRPYVMGTALSDVIKENQYSSGAWVCAGSAHLAGVASCCAVHRLLITTQHASAFACVTPLLSESFPGLLRGEEGAEGPTLSLNGAVGRCGEPQVRLLRAIKGY